MIRNLTLLCLLLTNQLCLAEEPSRTAPSEAGDMRVIFNGKDLTGWDGDPRLWSVKEGVLRGETTAQNPAKGNTSIIWPGGKTTDSELRPSFRSNAATNSGIQYRSKHVTAGHPSNKWVVRGYQHQTRT